MTDDIPPIEAPVAVPVPIQMEAAPPRGPGAEAAAARELAEMQAQVVLAQRNPRVVARCINDILEECKRYSFAETALFKYERGGSKISDGSIHLALAIATNWGNMDITVREVERRDGESVLQARAWDLQKNVKRHIEQIVPHKMKANKTIKVLTDPRDIYEHVFNQGARRLRKCIFDIVPPDVKRLAVQQVKRTLEIGPVDADGKPLQTVQQRVTTMVGVFRGVAVSVEMLEKRLGHAIDLTTASELVELQAVYNSIRDGAPRSEFFEPEGGAPATGTAEELRAKLHGEGK